MSGVSDYRRATNEACELLLSLPSFSLTTDVFEAVKLSPDCVVISYRKAIEHYGFDSELLASNSDYGFTFLDPSTQRRIILYNETLPESCIRFTIAHELGHYILGHLPKDQIASKAAEREANCFARNLLCPAPIAKELSLTSPEEYKNLFHVSLEMANISIQYRGLDLYHISETNHRNIIDLLYAYHMDFNNLNEFMYYLYA